MNKILRIIRIVFPVVMILAFFLIAFTAPLLAPQKDPSNPESFQIVGSSVDKIPHPPNEKAILGTLPGQFDVYFTLIWGTRDALQFGLIVVLTSVLFGTLVGAVGGYRGGRVNNLIMRVTDAFLTFPIIVSIVVLELLLSIYTSAKTTGLVLGPGALVIKIEMSETLRFLGTLLTNTNPLMVSLILFGWMPFTRILNDQILITKRKEYVEAARSIGASPFRIIFKHLIPNSIAPVIVLAARDIGGVIVLQSSFTFIGLGGDAPWAQLLAIGRNWIIGPKSNPFAYWWVFLPATLIIILFGISWSLFGDVVNEWLNPSAKTREVI